MQPLPRPALARPSRPQNGFSSIQQPGRGCARALAGASACTAVQSTVLQQLCLCKRKDMCLYVCMEGSKVLLGTQIVAPHGCCWSCLLRAVLQWVVLESAPCASYLALPPSPAPPSLCVSCLLSCPRLVMQPLTTMCSALYDSSTCMHLCLAAQCAHTHTHTHVCVLPGACLQGVGPPPAAVEQQKDELLLCGTDQS